MVLFSGITVPEQWKYHKSKKSLLLPCFLRLTTNFPEASQTYNLMKSSHRSRDTICSNTVPNVQHLLRMLHTISFYIGVFYTGSYFLHICSRHARDPGKDQHGCIFSRWCLLLFDCLIFPFQTWCHLQFIPHSFCKFSCRKLNRSWWQQLQLPHMHTSNLWEQITEDESANTSKMHNLG